MTTIRVVCQNTLALALQGKGAGEFFSRAHQSSNAEHAQAARLFFDQSIRKLDAIAESYTNMTRKTCSPESFSTIIETLFPFPRKSEAFEQHPGLKKAWETKTEATRHARQKIEELRESGKGMDLPGSRGTYWGVLNAVLEYEDHHRDIKGSRLSYALLGAGMDIKVKAFNLIQQIIRRAA